MNGELDFKASLQARVALLKGLEASIFPKIVEQMDVTPGAKVLITELHQRGYKVGLVSGGISWSHRSYREVFRNWSSSC